MSDYTLYTGRYQDHLPTLNEKVDLVFTDLPYGMTDAAWDEAPDLHEMWELLKPIVHPKTVFLFHASQPFTSKLVVSKLKWFKCEWIWQKNYGTNYLNAKYHPMKEHESLVMFCKEGAPYTPVMQKRTKPLPKKEKKNYKSDLYRFSSVRSTYSYSHLNEEYRYPSSIQFFKKEIGLHPCQKPIALCEYFIKTYSREGNVVLDFCMGSGSTGVAAVKNGRRFIGIEMDPCYVDIVHKRLHALVTSSEPS